MNIQLALELIKGLGLAIGIGLAFFIVPFTLLMLTHMIPWFIYAISAKVPFLRYIFFKTPENEFNKWRKEKESYIYYCHPTQVIQRFKNDGLNSLFRDYNSTKTPIHKPDAFCDKNTPINLFKSSYPIPVNDKCQYGLSHALHADNLAQDKEHVNQKGTLPPRVPAIN